MTLFEATPYTPRVIRTFLCIAPLALSACATSSSSSRELDELRGAVRALREENARLEQKLQRADARAAVADQVSLGNPTPAPASKPAPPEVADASVPQLTVVKLKPKKDAAPKLSTQVAIVEPSAETLEILERDTPASAPKDDAEDDDPTLGDAVFDKGVESLKTGNVKGGIEMLQTFAAESPKHAKADNALYFSGLGLMGLQEYGKAARAFEDVLARYPAGDTVIDAMLKLAECRLKLNRPNEARAVYQRIVSNYPGTAAANAAQTRLSSLR